MGTGLRRRLRLMELLEPRQLLSTVTVANATALESDGVVTFRVSLDAPAAGDVVVRYSASSVTATAEKDYRRGRGKLTIPAGETTGDITVGLKNDDRFEETETFRLELLAGGATLATSFALGTIVDDDRLPVISARNVSVKEGQTGDRLARVMVSLSSPAAVPLVVSYKTSDATPYFQAATAGSDYVTTKGTVTFLAGETKKAILVPILGDAVKEEHEVFTLTAKYGEFVTSVPDAVAVVTIKDDDRAAKKGEPVLRVADTLALEGAAGTTSDAGIRVTLSKPSDEDVTFRYSYGPPRRGTALVRAVGRDDVSRSGRITIPAGQTSATIPVTVVGNDAYQSNQSVSVRLTGVKGARPINGQNSVSAAVEIIDDEPVFFADASGTVVYGYSGFARVSDQLVAYQPIGNISAPVLYANGSLVGGGTATRVSARFDVAQLDWISDKAFVMNAGISLSGAGTLQVASNAYFGDANLNGGVNIDDYALIDRGIFTGSLSHGLNTSLTLSSGRFAGGGTSGGSGVQAGSVAGSLLTGSVSIDSGTIIGSSLLGSGDLDMTSKSVVFQSASVSSMRLILQVAFASGTWSGLTTSATNFVIPFAAADPTHRTAVGYAARPDGSVLAKVVLYGDANLDGAVDDADLAMLQQSLSSTDAAGPSWSAGDFNYDNVINADDLMLLDRNFGRSLGGAGSSPIYEARGHDAAGFPHLLVTGI